MNGGNSSACVESSLTLMSDSLSQNPLHSSQTSEDTLCIALLEKSCTSAPELTSRESATGCRTSESPSNPASTSSLVTSSDSGITTTTTTADTTLTSEAPVTMLLLQQPQSSQFSGILGPEFNIPLPDETGFIGDDFDLTPWNT
ncbi:hypothetical protein CEXT_136291 [Caerostris extrusa]|uniref:Uncharacterized protein n=1 Tax=Caerostris extrusa TaxID=172846 RepID=A0AAV4VJD2_CAEEX|nr:hypothetical protein CEXT_136291 [Caerostris extrusa]